jgi:hypothetical protein
MVRLRAIHLVALHLATGCGDIENPLAEASNAHAGTTACDLHGNVGPCLLVVLGPRLHQIHHRVRTRDADDRFGR